MRRPRDPKRRRAPVAALAAAALIVVVTLPYVALHLPQQQTMARPAATPLIADELHDQPFAIYDAFVAARDGCATATVIAQLDGGPARRLSVLRDAGLNRWNDKRRALRQSTNGCEACVAGRMRVRPAVREAAAKRLELLGGPPRSLECGFADRWVAAEPIDREFARRASTLIVECPVPRDLVKEACAGHLQIALRAPGRARPHPAVPLHVQPSAAPRALGACLWATGDAFAERSKRVGAAASNAVDEVSTWLAAHAVVGIESFLIYDNSRGVHARALTGEINSPLAAVYAPFRDKLEVVPWPDERFLDDLVKTATEGNLTAQTFFGRSSQFAALNSCHRRMRALGVEWVLHADADEYALPALASESLYDVVKRQPVAAAYAMPSIFYAPCGPAGAEGLASLTCAGRAVMHRRKLIAHTSRALLLHPHGVALGGSLHTLDPGRDARLVHARRGYHFRDAFAARAVLGERDGGASLRDAARFEALVRPRLAGAGAVACAAAPAGHKVKAPPAGETAVAARARRRDAMEVCDREDPRWRWCWCRDPDIATVWAPRVAGARRRLYGS